MLAEVLFERLHFFRMSHGSRLILIEEPIKDETFAQGQGRSQARC